VNDPNVQRFLAGTERFHKGHRSQTTFSTSLGFSEFSALALPFLLHFAATKQRSEIRAAAIAGIPVLLAGVVLSQARTGMIGVVASFLIYPSARAFIYWRRHPGSLAASYAVFLSPFLVAAGLACALVIPALRYRILGGGSEGYSNDARVVQLHMGIPKILSHPWGYGIGRGAETLGYVTANDTVTIDSYPLRLALEYGIVGLILYYVLFATALIYTARAALRAPEDDREGQLLIPIGIVLLSFVVMQTVFAQEDNQSVIFVILGLLMALRWRLSRPDGPTDATSAVKVDRTA
jgi:hypothetical protein